MPFRLRNTGLTYQQCMQSYFKEQTGHNLEVYVNNIVVKSRESNSLIADLEETFANLRRFNIRLNPKKCTFGVPRSMLLRYTITKRGIEVNPNKISAITEIDQVREDVQRLMGCLTALNHFMSRLGERGLPWYKLLKRSNSFHWMDEMQRVLDDLKMLISMPPVLACLEPGETLFLYVVATSQVISTILIVEQRSPGTSTRYNDRFTTLAKYSPTARPATVRYKSCFMSS
jgi:hypothetical protein